VLQRGMGAERRGCGRGLVGQFRRDAGLAIGRKWRDTRLHREASMAVRIVVDPDQRLASRTYSGVVTSSDLLDSIKQYPTMDGFDPSYDELMDFRQAENISAMVEDIHRCAVQPAPFDNKSRRVILAPQELVYGLARMYQILGEDVHPNIYVVRTMEEANRILKS